MSNEKIYVGGGKEKTGNFGVFHSISFSAQDLETLKQNLNAKGYVNLNFNKRQTPSQYGQTHSLTVDTWQPQEGYQPQQQGQAPQQGFQQQAPQQQQQFQQQPAPQQFQQGAPVPQQFQQPGGYQQG